MSLKLRGGVYHYRKMFDGHTLSFSTKKGDEKPANEIATIKEAQFLRELVVAGKHSIKLHEAIEAWLKQRVGTAGHANSKRHIYRFKKLPNGHLQDLSQIAIQCIVEFISCFGTQTSAQPWSSHMSTQQRLHTKRPPC